VTFHTEILVPWADIDAADIVWFGNYFRYLDRAEQAMFLSLGFTYQAIDTRFSILLPRTKLTCAFRSPARLGDVLDVGLSVSGTTVRRAHLRFVITQRDDRRVVVEGDYSMACVDRATFAARDFPGELIDPLTARVIQPSTSA
jgi:acyl-CoA thioester hydrolase